MAVDDDLVTLTLLKGVLAAEDMAPHGFSDPFAAFQALQNHPDQYDLLITDINMPGMDGLELLRAVRLLSPLLPVIVLTSRDDKESVRKALQLGANDYLDKPVQQTALIESIRTILSSAPRKRIEESMKTSQGVRDAQQALMQSDGTRQLFEQERLAFWHRPLTDAGGDFLYGATFGPGQYHLTLVDAAGHDVLSSYHVAECKGLMEALAGPGVSPEDFLARLNGKLIQLPHQRHICALDMRWDPGQGIFRLANAGLPHGCLLRASGSACIPLALDGTMLGLLDHAAFDALQVQLAPGDRLLFFTDGLETLCEPQDLLKAWAELRHEKPLGRALSLLTERMGFDQAAAPQDDLLLLALEQAPNAACTPSLENACLGLAFGSERRAIEPHVQKILAFLNDFAPVLPSPEKMHEVATSLRELLSNAILHGNQEKIETPVLITVKLSGTHPQLTVRVCDRGEGFDLNRQLESERHADPLRDGQRGLLAAATFANRLSVDGQGVVAEFNWEA